MATTVYGVDNVRSSKLQLQYYFVVSDVTSLDLKFMSKKLEKHFFFVTWLKAISLGVISPRDNTFDILNRQKTSISK